MDKSLIRSEPFLGNTKTIVGDKMADLVLETLGKVYIKFGRSTRLLNDLFTLLDKSTTNTEDIRSKIIIVNSEQELRDLEYPGDGYFVYNTLTSILYLSYQREYVPLVNASDYKEGAFVKKSGDTMSGPLEINTSSSPLIIASKALVNNLNVEFLNGYGSDDFAKKRIDEIITGSWTFQNLCTSENNWIFKDNIRLYKDIVSSGSISTPEFASGFAGYGWRLDGDTNTLTIDYLVVRKAMRVFEMVINQISATNGSLWVSNSSKCASARQPIIVDSNGVIYGETDSNNNSIKVEFDSSSKQFSNLRSGEYYIFEGVPGGVNTVIMPGSNLSTPSKIGTSTRFREHYYLFYINDPEGLASSGLVNSMSDLYNAALSDTNPLSNYVTIYNTGLKDGLNVDAEFPAYVNNQLVYIKTYYKYFGVVSAVNNNYWIIETDEESYPLFKQGDIVRCQKYSEGNIKYYDALVLTQLTSRKFLMQKATSVFDIYTEISYGDDGSVESMTEEINKTQYEKTSTGDLDDESVLDDPAEKDDMIQIGNIENIDRQNAIYLTSTDDQSPYIDIISGLNRPDYSVIYNIPKYVKYVTTDPDTKRRRSYYVSTVSGGVRLGKFQLDQNTNEIVQKVDDSVIGRFSILYGYDYPTSVNSCLIQKENGLDKYEYTKTTKVRLGRLDGIYNSMFGNNQPYGFGLYGENVFLTGEFYLNNGTSMVEIANDYISLQNGYNTTKITVEQLEKWANGEDGTGYSKLMSEKSVKGMLESSGLHLTKDDGGRGIAILYGDQVKILTGWDGKNPEYAAIFQNGKILAERIDLGNLILQNGSLPDIGEFTEYSCKSYSYTESTVKSTSDIPIFGSLSTGTIVMANSEDATPSTSATYTIESSDNPISMKFSIFCVRNNNTETDFKMIEAHKVNNPGSISWDAATCRRYCSVSVSYVDTSGKTHVMICKDSLKDVEIYSDDILSEVDKSLVDLNNFFGETFNIRSDYGTVTGTTFDRAVRKYNFSFSTIPSVTEYTIRVSGGVVRTVKYRTTSGGADDPVQVVPTRIIDGVGLMIGNPSLYPSDITSIPDTDGTSGYNSYSEKFSNTGYNYSSIIKYSEVYTYITPEGILSGSSPDSYMQVTSEYFTASYGGNEFVVDTNGIRYRIKGGNWKNFN